MRIATYREQGRSEDKIFFIYARLGITRIYCNSFSIMVSMAERNEKPRTTLEERLCKFPGTWGGKVLPKCSPQTQWRFQVCRVVIFLESTYCVSAHINHDSSFGLVRFMSLPVDGSIRETGPSRNRRKCGKMANGNRVPRPSSVNGTNSLKCV